MNYYIMNKSRFLSTIPPVTKNLIILNTIFWLSSLLFQWKFNFSIVDRFGMHYWRAPEFNPVQIITYMFLHDPSNFFHLFFNMFGVYMFGRTLEEIWGGKKFLFFYFFAGIGAAIAQQVIWEIDFNGLYRAFQTAIAQNSGTPMLAYEGTLRKYLQFGNLANFDAVHLHEMKNMLFNAPLTIGASGAIFGILIAFGFLFPNIKLIMLFFPVPIKAKYFVILYGVLELFMGVANFSGDNVAHFAHLGGMIFGLILILYWRKKGKLYNR